MRNLIRRLKQQWQTQDQLLEGPESLRVLLRGSPGFAADLVFLWGLTGWKSSCLAQSRQRPDCDLLIQETTQAPVQGVIRSQLLVDMLTPLRPDFELFLTEVLSKKKRYHVKKSLSWNHEIEPSRDHAQLKFFMDTMLHPQTEITHKENAHHLHISDVLKQGMNWELILLKDEQGYRAGSLLLHSQRQGILRIWRQAVDPKVTDHPRIQLLKMTLDSAAIRLACSARYSSVSFGLTPHIIEHGNFYSKRLWACEPHWNHSPFFIHASPHSERGERFLESIPILCQSPNGSKPDGVLIPKDRLRQPTELKAWLDRFAYRGLRYLVTLEAGLTRWHSMDKPKEPSETAP